MNEFAAIAALLRPLTRGAPEALGLTDDAAVIPARPGFDLVVTKDAMVEGVHFLKGDAPGHVAQKLLRVNLSDLASKGADPYAYCLATAWPSGWGEGERAAFAEGLSIDQDRFGLFLLGGDTVSTPGPFTVSATLFGWVPAGGVVKRSGAREGDVLMVSGAIGDGWLGLKAALDEPFGASPGEAAGLLEHYRRPEPRLALRQTLRRYARAAADVSDGLLADAGHIGEASGLGVEIALERTPLSPAAAAWLARQDDRCAARLALATGGDDYEIVCAVDPKDAEAAMAAAAGQGTPLTPIGRMTAGAGVRVTFDGAAVSAPRKGWAHP